MNYAQGGLAALHKKAQQLENASRAPDTTLVHMAPNEVMALRQLAMEKYGTDLPRNPKTGLYEAGILSTLLGAGLSLIPGVGPLAAGAIMGAGTALAGGKPKDILMNAIGGYGGAGLGSALQGAAAQGAMAAGVPGADAALQAANPELAKTVAAESAKNATAATAQAAPQMVTDIGAQNAFNTELNRFNLQEQALASGKELPFSNIPAGPAKDALLADMPNAVRGEALAANTSRPAFTEEMLTKAPTATPNYSDLSVGQKAGYAWEHMGKDPWKFMTKEVGAGPTTIVGSSLMEAMNNPQEVKKRESTFYDYDYDPNTGTFIERGRSNKPSWQAAGGGRVPRGGIADADRINSMAAEMEAAAQKPSFVDRLASWGAEQPFLQSLSSGVQGGLEGLGLVSAYKPITPEAPLSEEEAKRQSEEGLSRVHAEWRRQAAQQLGLAPAPSTGWESEGAWAGGGTVGRFLSGSGDGVSDSIPAMIDGQQPAALADGEYVIPARVVAELGNGSSQAGAKKLDAMLSRVERVAKKAKRGKDSKAERYLPA